MQTATLFQNSIEDQALAWMEQNEESVRTFCLIAMKESGNGKKKIGAKAIVEFLRCHMEKEYIGYKFNNTFTRYMAQEAVRRFPCLERVFSFRERKES